MHLKHKIVNEAKREHVGCRRVSCDGLYATIGAVCIVTADVFPMHDYGRSGTSGTVGIARAVLARGFCCRGTVRLDITRRRAEHFRRHEAHGTAVRGLGEVEVLRQRSHPAVFFHF